jgi:hypothetical protein
MIARVVVISTKVAKAPPWTFPLKLHTFLGTLYPINN